jgi:signal peptidase
MTATMPQFARRTLVGFQVAAALALLALVLLLLAGTAPSVLGYESFVVYSGSMEPAIMTGDIAVVGPVKAGELKVGDVITFRTAANPDVVVTHRLVSLETDAGGHLMFSTKGDANDIVDQVQVEQGALLGRVVYSLPRLGYMVDFSKRTEGKALFIALPGILLAGDYLRARLRRGKAAAAIAPVLAAAPAAVQFVVPTATAPVQAASYASAPAVVQASAPDAARVLGLLAGGRRALDAGYLELASRAADGALKIDARNEDAWILKAQATGDSGSGITLLQTAVLVLTPSSHRIAAALQALQSQKEHAAA